MEFILMWSLLFIVKKHCEKCMTNFSMDVMTRNAHFLTIDWWLVVVFLISLAIHGQRWWMCWLFDLEAFDGCVCVVIIVGVKFLYDISSTIILFTLHSETFDNNKPWDMVSIDVVEVPVLFVLFYLISNPMNLSSLLLVVFFLFHLDRLLMFLLLVNWLCPMFGCWMYSFDTKLIRYAAFGMFMLLVFFDYSCCISWFNRVYTTILDGIHCNTLFNNSQTTINHASW